MALFILQNDFLSASAVINYVVKSLIRSLILANFIAP